jgi:predicted RNA-binding protein (virulence factor B family)
MLLIGKKQRLKAIRFVPEGVFLDDGAEGVLLPRKQVPAGLRTDDEVEVFIYNDGDGATNGHYNGAQRGFG